LKSAVSVVVLFAGAAPPDQFEPSAQVELEFPVQLIWSAWAVEPMSAERAKKAQAVEQMLEFLELFEKHLISKTEVW
jgi:hypothetical protein